MALDVAEGDFVAVHAAFREGNAVSSLLWGSNIIYLVFMLSGNSLKDWILNMHEASIYLVPFTIPGVNVVTITCKFFQLVRLHLVLFVIILLVT